MDNAAQDDKAIITHLLQRLFIILGPTFTLMKMRHIPELKIANDGTVSAISGDPQAIKQQIRDQFNDLSKPLIDKIFA